jgi:hypothetical protein
LQGRKENATDADYAGYLQFSTRKNAGNLAERMRVTSDGNLGIGTTAPGLKTHIFGITGFPATTGTAQIGVLRLQGSSSQAVLDFGVNGASGSYLQATNQTALTANYPLLLNPNGGSVGIGSTTPQTALEVKSGIVNIPAPLTGGIASFGRNGHASISIVANPANKSSIYFANTADAYAGGILYDNATNTMAFRTNNISDQFIINATGSVGIGTTAPPTGYKLAVNGNILATAVTVKLYSEWSDYVFDKDYKLPALSQVKEYIDKNHHLPDMPSAKEVKDNGLNLGEMNAILTKKVEELTLYLIEQNKRIEQLEARLGK